MSIKGDDDAGLFGDRSPFHRRPHNLLVSQMDPVESPNADHRSRPLGSKQLDSKMDLHWASVYRFDPDRAPIAPNNEGK